MEITKIKIKRNITLFKLASFFDGLWPLSPLAVIYFEQITNSYAIAMGIFSIANILQCIMEIPTGILSDRLGRKYTLCSSSFCFVICFLLYALAGNYNSTELLVVGSLFWGIAIAFVSGTDEAMMYETMEQLKLKSKYDIIFSQAGMFTQLGLALGAIIGAIITYFYSLNTLAWICVIPMFIHFVITLFYIEPNKSFNDKKDNSFKHFLEAIKKIKHNKKLQIISLLQILDRSSGYAAHSIEGAFFNTLIPLYFVNLIRMIKQITGAISYYIVKYIRKFSFFHILVASSIGNILVRASGLLLHNTLTPFIMSMVNLFYGTSTTAQSALIQKELSTNERATMKSIISMCEGICFAVFYYLVGLLADNFSLFAVMWILVFIKIITAYGYFLMLKKYR